MNRTHLSLVAVLAWTLLAGAAYAAQEEEAPKFVNYDRFIGREAVEDGRGLDLKLFRPLPLQCPPFRLLDEDGNVIDPTKDEDGDPVVPELDENGEITNADALRAAGPPVSTKQTCGVCHPYEKITHGYHFQAGRNELFKEEDADGPSRSPGFFGKWHPFYQRQLSPVHYGDPSDVDMSPWEFALNCAICHPGGGPMEFDRAGRNYVEQLESDRGATLFGMGDYEDEAWQKTGVLEADCFMCHLEGYEFSLRVQEMKKLNFKWASTAGAGLGYVWGSVKKGQEPKIYYNKDIFRADGTVFLHISRPDDERCMTCHDISSAQKRGQSWHSHYMQDVHTEQNLGCTDCHPGDIRHNFAKGSSSTQTVRDDLDGTALSCKGCHEAQEHGAPNYKHDWLPPLHLERIDCTACHITHRPFVPAGTVDTITGAARTLPAPVDFAEFDTYRFGAKWGKLASYDESNLLTPFSAAELDKAAAYSVPADAALRSHFISPGGTCRLPEGTIVVGDFVEAQGGAVSDDARALMCLALMETAGIEAPEQVVVILRGQAEVFDAHWLAPITAKLQPRRPGASIAETPYILGRAKGGEKIYPESYQLGVYWAYVEDGEAQPLFLSDMQAANDLLSSDEFRFLLYQGEPSTGQASPGLPEAVALPEVEAEAAPEDAPAADPAAVAKERKVLEQKLNNAIWAKLKPYDPRDRQPLEIHDDNNDTFPEANTEWEMGVMAWALKQANPRLSERELYYIKGTTVHKVDIGAWANPYDAEVLDMDRIGENEPFLAIQRFEESEKPGENSWDAPVLAWRPVELRVAEPFDYAVETVADPVLAALAQRMSWTVSHGVESPERALGAKGCCDCHSDDSHFFFGPVVVDPYGEDGTPETVPMHEILGYSPCGIKLGAWRENVLKPLAPWVVLLVFLAILLHFALIGSKDGTPPGKPNVLRFRFHERLSHLIAMSTVTLLCISGFFFLLGRSPLGPWARELHTHVGYVGSAGVVLIFVSWFLFMFPAKGDIKWLLVAGGYLGGVKGHLPAGKFNAGQKILFWVAIASCATLVGTGLVMGLNRAHHFANQELFYTLHDVAALLMIIVLMAHVYLAAFVVPHSLRAVFGGKVSHIWADAHHANWKYRDKGKLGKDAH